MIQPSIFKILKKKKFVRSNPDSNILTHRRAPALACGRSLHARSCCCALFPFSACPTPSSTSCSTCLSAGCPRRRGSRAGAQTLAGTAAAAAVAAVVVVATAAAAALKLLLLLLLLSLHHPAAPGVRRLACLDGRKALS